MEKEIKKEKLGFVLTNTNFGMQEAFAVNKDSSWARYISDVRSAINHLINFDGTGKIVYLLRFLGKEGYLFTIIKARPQGSGRPTDNSAAWIHIPANADISNKEMVDVIKDVVDAISCELESDWDKIKRTFEKSYPTKGVASTILENIVSNQEAGYAVRYFGKNTNYTISELLGNTIAQEEYSKYKGVFFIDKEWGVTLNSGTEITSNCKEIYTYPPLQPTDGFTPYLDGKPFINQQIEVSEGSKHTIVWERRGYADIEKSITIKSNSSEDCPQWPASAQIMPNDYKVIIHRGMFIIKNENEEPINNAQIFVDNQLLTNERPISEARYKEGLDIRITANGYGDDNQKVKDLMNKQHKVIMNKTKYTYKFTIPIYDEKQKVHDEKAEVTLNTTLKLYKSPIKGYEGDISPIPSNKNTASQNKGNQELKLKNPIMQNLKFAFIGFVACLLCVMVWKGCSYVWNNYQFEAGFPWIHKNETKKDKVAQNINTYTLDSTQTNTSSDNKKGNPVNQDSINAMNYLLENDKWHKDSLDKYEPTRGMFEELNEYKFDALEERIETKLCKTEILEKLIKARPSKEKNPYYNQNNDNKIITISGYIEKLKDREAQPKTKSTTQPKKKGNRGSV